MFLSNKYTKWYYSIIEQATNRKIDQYTESHHVIPKSMGGSNSKSNLVKLTGREHFVCHWLLTKMTTGENRKKMIHALWSFTRKSKNQNREKITGRKYERIRQQVSQMLSESRKGIFNVGRVHTQETRNKVSAATKGKPKSDETKKAMKKAWETRSKIPWNKGMKGNYTFTDEARLKMSESKQNMDPEKRKQWVNKMSTQRKGIVSAYDLKNKCIVKIDKGLFDQLKNIQYVGLNSKLRIK